MTHKIFVLDDDENSCALAQKVLTKAGYEVMITTRAIGASSTIRSFAPHLVLLDVMMPALSGDALAEIISRTVHPRPKILFYSNKSAQDLDELVRSSGVDGFVCKVDGPTALLKKIKKALA